MPFGDRLYLLLSELEDPELETIWTQALRCKVDARDFEGGSRDWRIACISAEWRAVHGHTLANRTRSPHALPWKRILIDVADKLHPGFGWTSYRMSDAHTEEELEGSILKMFDEHVRKMWAQMSPEKRQALAQTVDDELRVTAAAMQKHSHVSGARSVTVASLGSGISAGLLTGGGALVMAQGAASTVFAGVVGGGVLYQIGLWFVVQMFGAWAGVKLAVAGGAAMVGAKVVAGPLAIVATAAFLMSPSYRKSIPATLILLTAHELRRQIAALEG